MYPQMTKKEQKVAKSHFCHRQALPISKSVTYHLVYHLLNTKDKHSYMPAGLSAGPWEHIAPSNPTKMAKLLKMSKIQQYDLC